MPKKKAATENDREVAALEARIKRLRGGVLTKAEQADVAWLERQDATFYADLWAKNCTKADYCRLSGRQQKQLDDITRLYGLPLDGPKLNLYDIIKALHDLIASNAKRIRAANTDTDDREELEKEKLRKQIEGIELDNENKEIDLQYARGDAIPKKELRIALTALQAHLRIFGQQLRRSKNPGMVDDWNEFLKRLSADIASGKLSFTE